MKNCHALTQSIEKLPSGLDDISSSF